MKIIILGGGLIGGPMALDLAKESGFQVTRLVSTYDLVINAVPGFMGFLFP